MKWIKTSERLPKITDRYCIITQGAKTGKWFNINEDEEEWKRDVECWLDESKPLWFVKPKITDTDRMNWLDDNLHMDTINDLGNFECENGIYINKLREFIDNKINNM